MSIERHDNQGPLDHFQRTIQSISEITNEPLPIGSIRQALFDITVTDMIGEDAKVSSMVRLFEAVVVWEEKHVEGQNGGVSLNLRTLAWKRVDRWARLVDATGSCGEPTAAEQDVWSKIRNDPDVHVGPIATLFRKAVDFQAVSRTNPATFSPNSTA